MKAVVYTSESGFTKKCAEILSEKAGLPVYDLKTAISALAKGDEIIYLGWLMAGFIKGYKKAAKNFDVKAVCAVGMGTPGSQSTEKIKNQNHIGIVPVFYLQGGFDINKLHELNKYMMSSMSKGVGKKLSEKPDKTVDEKDMLDLMLNGGDRVSEESISQVVSCLKGAKII